jgi:lipid-binding SYLF domain-containing protein
MDTFKKQEILKPYFENAYGCAAFPSVAKGGLFFVGGAYGKGSLYKLPSEEIVGSVELKQASAGWVLGGEVYQEIIFFETEADFKNFTAGNFEFAADAKVVALTAAASAKGSTMGNQGIQVGKSPDETKVSGADKGAAPVYTKGMKVFTVSVGGLMYQATISGQKFDVKMN